MKMFFCRIIMLIKVNTHGNIKVEIFKAFFKPIDKINGNHSNRAFLLAECLPLLVFRCYGTLSGNMQCI